MTIEYIAIVIIYTIGHHQCIFFKSISINVEIITS